MEKVASREELLRSISLSMKLDKDFFLRIYGYEITWPGFAETALQRLEVLGCSKARVYYNCVVAEYEQRQEESIKPVAAEYAKRLKEKWNKKEKEGSEERRKQKEKAKIMEGLETMSDGDLLRLWQQRK